MRGTFSGEGTKGINQPLRLRASLRDEGKVMRDSDAINLVELQKTKLQFVSNRPAD